MSKEIVHSRLDQHDYLDFYSASSLKQQFMDRHATPLGHISLIKNLTVFTISPKCCVLSVEATHTNFIKRIIGVMVSVLASSVVDRGFEPRSGQTNDYKIYI
jgi:hypothetical protein